MGFEGERDVRVEGRVLKEVFKASGGEPIGHKSTTRQQGKGVSWDDESVVLRPPVPARSSSAIESFDQHSHPPSPRPVHGGVDGLVTAGGMHDPDYRRSETTAIHGSPNHRNTKGKGYERRLRSDKGRFFNDDSGTFGARPSRREHFHGFRVKNGILYDGGVNLEDDEELDEAKKKDVYAWIVGLSVDVKPELLGLEGQVSFSESRSSADSSIDISLWPML